MTTALPVSPIGVNNDGAVAKPGVVQINLAAVTGEIVTGAEFGLATTMGPNWSYSSYADPSFQALADQYPTDLLRHNWELNTLMDQMFPSRASASTPNYSSIDTYLNQQGNLKGFINNQTATQIVTLGFPSWLNITDLADQALYATLVKGIAQHFIAGGEPISAYELVNEPDGHYSATDLAHIFNATADALHSVDPNYKLGGLTESYVHQDDLQTFLQIAGKNIGFVSWHQYVTNGSDGKSAQQIVDGSMNGVQSAAQQVRGLMRAAGISDNVPLFLGEYNVNGAVYTDPDNANMTGAIAAAATTYGMIHSNTNMDMGALWDAQNDSAYSVFGSQGNYGINPVGVVLADFTAYMPGNLVQTTMPSNAPGLIGYTTQNGQGFSTALIDTNLGQGYTVDLSQDGLPTTGLHRVEVSSANPHGVKTAITDLSHVAVAAGSLVIITNEAPHGGTLFNGSTTAPPNPTTPTPPPANPDPTNPNPPAPIGTGADTLVLNLSEDAYQGDAQFTLTVDGKQLGPVQSVTALHRQGQTEAFTFHGDWGAGPHRFGVAFVNDAWGGTDTTDRNLYIDGATFDGNQVQSGVEQKTNSTVTFSTPPAQQPPSPPAAPTSHPTVGTGADTLVLNLSEDAYQGDAQFTLMVDGSAVGPTQTVTGAHGQGQPEAFTFKGDWTGSTHTVGISFSNPASGGSAGQIRNLYLDGATFDGNQVEGATAITGNSPVTFTLGSMPKPPNSASPTVSMAVTDSSGSTSPVALISTGSHTDHPSGTSTITQTVANGADTLKASGTVKSEAVTLGAGPQKLILVNPRSMVLTAGSGADTVTADTGHNSFTAGAGSLDVTGGSDASQFVLHSGSGQLTIEDFDLAKGDTLSVDKALQGALKQASDGHGGTLLTFGSGQGTIDLINHATLNQSSISFI